MWSFLLKGIIAMLVESIIIKVTIVLPKVSPSLTKTPWETKLSKPEVWTWAIWMLISLSPVLTSAREEEMSGVQVVVDPQTNKIQRLDPHPV